MIKRTILLSVFLAMNLASSAQGIIEWKELIIRTPKLNEWTVFKINRWLHCLDGVHLSGYYQPSSCLLIKYDTSKIIDPAIIKVVISYLNQKMKSEVLSGYTIYDIVDDKYVNLDLIKANSIVEPIKNKGGT
jgi:hypothetical protein